MSNHGLFESPFSVDYNRKYVPTKTDDTASSKEHESEYRQLNIEKEVERQAGLTVNNSQYTDNAPLGQAIDLGKELNVAVDIGSGTGWAAGLLSKTKDVVYAIEPAVSAVSVAKKIHVNNAKIIWINGFAQEELKKITLSGPALFNSLCVLSHLQDYTVIEICKEVDKLAEPGSILSFSECYGCAYDDGNLWHVREEAWWKERFPGWQKFDFSFGMSIDHPRGAKKNFLAVK